MTAELRRSRGEGKGYLLQYSCLENPCAKEPGGLPSMAGEGGRGARVRHDRATNTFTFFFSTFKETILLLFEDPVLSSPEAIVDLHNIHFINYYHY